MLACLRSDRWVTRLFLLLAGGCFGLYALLLTLIPAWATVYGSSSTQAGILVAVLAITGLVGDSLVGRLATRIGARASILAGAGIAGAGSAVLAIAGSFNGFLLAAALCGAALALMTTPILAGLSIQASHRLIQAHSVNAVSQRLGALGVSFALMNVVSRDESPATVVTLVALVLLLIVGASLLPPRKLARRQVLTEIIEETPLQGRRPTLLTKDLGSGLLIYTVTPLLLIVGSSFFPLILAPRHLGHLLMYCLALREVLAVISALAIFRVRSRRTLEILWVSSAIIGAIGLAASTLVQNEVVLVLLLACHGPAIGIGITIGNVKIADGSIGVNSYHAFAIGSVVSRLASLIYPVLFGYALAFSSSLLLHSAAVCIVVIIVVYLARGIILAGYARSNNATRRT